MLENKWYTYAELKDNIRKDTSYYHRFCAVRVEHEDGWDIVSGWVEEGGVYYHEEYIPQQHAIITHVLLYDDIRKRIR